MLAVAPLSRVAGGGVGVADGMVGATRDRRRLARRRSTPMVGGPPPTRLAPTIRSNSPSDNPPRLADAGCATGVAGAAVADVCVITGGAVNSGTLSVTCATWA